MKNDDNITPLSGSHLPAVQNHGAIRPYGHQLEDAERDEDTDEIDLRELWQVLIRRKWLILSIAALVFLASLVVTLMMKPTYRASTTIQIKEEAQVLEYDVESKGGKINHRDFYQTQYELLKSRMLAKRTIEDLGMESVFHEAKLADIESSWLGDINNQFKALFSGSTDNTQGEAETEDIALDEPESDTFIQDETDEKQLLGERPIADILLDQLSVAPVKNSQIVTVQYTDTNPERAATIVNTLASNFIEVNLERRIDAASYAEDRVQDEIVKTRSRLLEAEEKLNNYAKEKGIVLTEDNESLVNKKLRELSASLTKAEAQRVKTEIAYNETRNSDSANKVLGNSTIQTLKKQLAETESQYKAALKASSSFDNANISSLRQRLAQLQSQYQAEITSSQVVNNPSIRSMTQQLAGLQSEYQGELSASRAVDDPTVRSLTQELNRLQSEYQAELTSPQAIDNPVVRTMRGRLVQLQSEYQAELSASSSLNNPTVRTLRQRLAQLQTQLQGGQGNNATSSTIQSLKGQVAQLESQYQEKAQVYKPAYPLMVQLRQKINEIKQQIVRENASVRNNLTQQINQLKQEINRETRAVTQNTRTNLTEQIKQLQADIARETSTVTNSSRTYLKRKIDQVRSDIARQTNIVANNKRTYLKKKIDQLRSDINRETRSLQTGTQSYLKKQIDQLRAEIARETRASDQNTRITLEQRIAELKRQIAAETARIDVTVQDSLKGLMVAAREQEDAIRRQLEDQKIASVTLRDQNVGLNELKRELGSIRNIYTGLLDRQKQIGIAGGIGNNNIAVVDEAIIPFKKHKPNTLLNLMLGAVLGLFLGTVLAFLLELLDDRIKNADELSKVSGGLPLLGIIPRAKQKDSLKLAMMTQTDPRSAFAESFRSLRTNLKFSTRDGVPAVIAITSSSASEGKSTSAINIATTFAQDGNTVLLVDTDLRNPSVHKRLRIDNSKGLTNYLTNQDNIESVTQSCQIPGVYVVTAGPMTPNPVELLSSDRLDELYAMARIEKTFDIIVLDMPPVLGLADALVISSRADATMVAVSMGESKKQILLGSLKRLYHARANVIGFIATKTKQGSGYGYNYNYDYYSYGNDKKYLDAA